MHKWVEANETWRVLRTDITHSFPFVIIHNDNAYTVLLSTFTPSLYTLIYIWLYLCLLEPREITFRCVCVWAWRIKAEKFFNVYYTRLVSPYPPILMKTLALCLLRYVPFDGTIFVSFSFCRWHFHNDSVYNARIFSGENNNIANRTKMKAIFKARKGKSKENNTFMLSQIHERNSHLNGMKCSAYVYGQWIKLYARIWFLDPIEQKPKNMCGCHQIKTHRHANARYDSIWNGNEKKVCAARRTGDGNLLWNFTLFTNIFRAQLYDRVLCSVLFPLYRSLSLWCRSDVVFLMCFANSTCLLACMYPSHNTFNALQWLWIENCDDKRKEILAYRVLGTVGAMKSDSKKSDTH